LGQLLLGFCQTGVRPADGISFAPPVDVYFFFEGPRSPNALSDVAI
jgi:hypothetical protein